MKTMTYIKGTAAACAVAFVLSGCSMLESLPVPPAGTTAAEYYAKAVKGDAEAQHALGCCYAFAKGYPKGVEEDREVAKKWYLKAAKQGYTPAMCNLAFEYSLGDTEQEAREALRWYRKAAELGNAEAQYKMADYYLDDDGLLPKDVTAAFKCYLKSAENGYQLAYYDVAQCYRYGKGCTQNRSEAIRWYRKAMNVPWENGPYADILATNVRKKDARKALQELGAL